ncbi:Calx-beta domain-containing protein [Agrobacterium tumefaciens]|uniref:Calx-beta domain-containing protein n=1 Tax=Agrobacterium tumefaciens TaxID=358 RepID=UPI0015746A59|nr:hypothetical protein [Agrobacterium tumefaciens]
MKAQYLIELSKAVKQTTSVQWKTEQGSAVPSVDYVHAEGELVFSPGETSKPVSIEVIDRPSATESRTFYVRIDNANGLLIEDELGACVIPPGSSTLGPLIRNGLITNSYHNVLGRDGYFHANSGTSEGQAVAIEAAFLAYEVLRVEDSAPATEYLSMALKMLDAMGDGSRRGPMLRQPFPTSSSTITLMHWLFAARGDIPSQSIVYDQLATAVGGKLTIPRRGADVFKVWMIYPATSHLLYQSPYSPAFDNTSPAGETQRPVAATDWRVVGESVEITAPVTGSWYIVYGLNNSGIIGQGEAQEAYPCWTKIADGYSACAPDTFRWLDLALNMAIKYDTRPGRLARWTALRDALRRSAVRGQAVSDLRDVLKPWPGLPALPFTGEPSGTFCYSNHPAATAPTEAPGWSGYNFWSRETDGSLKASVPNAADTVHQVQFGRGFNDSWREATAYQDADQYLWVSLSFAAAADLLATGKAYIYVSSTKSYSGSTRWYADISLATTWAALTAAYALGGVVDLYLPRTAFKRKDLDNAVLPSGTKLENFGVSIEFKGAYTARIRNLRMVAADTEAAKKGSKMPFFPGSMPFAINADTVAQQFVGWNGSPFHGYQLPDFWYFLESHANAVHPNLTSADLPTCALTSGALVYQIQGTNPNGALKPKHAMLMEQQLLFLQRAQEKWQLDMGYAGPWAHTFVLNTPARMTIGNPTPHTWVYTNDDPNTRWMGYQARVVESLAKTAYLTRYDSSFQYANNTAAEMATIWLDWLNRTWTGAGVPWGAATIYGPPNEVSNAGVKTTYEDPHTAALVLRACIWLKQAKPTLGALCDTISLRCWEYLERLWVTDGFMRRTWSPDPAAGEWFGFWHFEIIATLAVMLSPGARPELIDASLVRRRLIETQQWLTEVGIK